jgi:tape measure domain-containing protein
VNTRNYQISITVTGYDKASGPLGGVKNTLGGLGTIAGGILTAGLLTSIGRQIADIGRQALDSYASYERLGMALQSLVARELLNSGAAKDMGEAMGMSAEKAKELQDWITKLAIQSPFQQEDIANSFRLAMAYGFTTDEAKRLTTAMTDFASGSGASSDTMNRIALALGQIKAKGKLAGQEMLQLTEAGLDVRGILAKAFGKTTEEIVAMQEKGLIPADKAIQAIVESLENDFGGAAAKQAGTFSGLLASMADLKTVGLRTFFEGTFKAIQPYVQKFVDTLSDPAFMGKLEAAGQKLGDFIAIALDGFARLQSDIQLFRARLEIFMQTPAFKKILENFKKITDVFTESSIVSNAGRVFDGIKKFLQDLGEKVIPFAVSMFDKIANWFEENGPLIAAYVEVMTNIFLNVFLPALLLVWDVVQPLLQGLIDLVLNLATFWMQVFTGDIPGAMATLQTLVADVFTAIGTAFMNLLSGIALMMGTSLQEIGLIWSANWEQLKQIAATIWQIMGDTIRGFLAQIATNFMDGLTRVREWLHGQADEFLGAGTNIIEGLQSGIENAFGNVVSAVEQAMTTVKNTIAGFAGALYEAGVSIINSLGSGLQSAFDGILSGFWDLGRQIIEAIKGGIGEAFADLLSWFSGLLGELLSLPGSGASSLNFGTMDNLRRGFPGGGSAATSGGYFNNSRDQSTKYYAPVYVTVTQPDPELAAILKGTRKR